MHVFPTESFRNKNTKLDKEKHKPQTTNKTPNTNLQKHRTNRDWRGTHQDITPRTTRKTDKTLITKSPKQSVPTAPSLKKFVSTRPVVFRIHTLRLPTSQLASLLVQKNSFNFFALVKTVTLSQKPPQKHLQSPNNSKTKQPPSLQDDPQFFFLPSASLQVHRLLNYNFREVEVYSRMRIGKAASSKSSKGRWVHR